MATIDKITYSGTTYDIGGSGGGSGLTSEMKLALLACFENVAWVHENGQTYYDALETALYPPQNIVSISATYTQSGTVYTTDTLDSLRSDLVVTALYDDSSSDTVTSYTLSGTLTAGTSTITVTYAGKTATFTVTVTTWTTSPRIAQTNKGLGTDGTIQDKTGGCVTETYYFTAPVNALKDTQYYDSTNNCANTNGVLFLFVYNFSNDAGVSFSGINKIWHTDSSGSMITYATSSYDEADHNQSSYKDVTGYFTSQGNVLGLKFTLSYADREKCYAYWSPAASTNLLPAGVSSGDIIFAGSETQYYGKTNIYD